MSKALSPDEVRQELVNHLEWNPPKLIEEKCASGSDYTRSPAFWDTHLHEDLILKKIVCLPSLTETLAKLVDDLLTKLKEDGTLDRMYGNPKMFPPISLRESFPDARAMKDEASVVNYYAGTTANIYPHIASALEFQTPKARSILTWTQSHRHDNGTTEANQTPRSPNPSSKASKSPKAPSKAPKIPNTYKAIADGFLRIDWGKVDLSSLSAEQRRGLEALRKHFANLAVWEFKSVAAGSLKVMQAIAGLAGKPFYWTTCSETGYKCKNSSHLQINGMPKVTRARTGLDATDTPWEIPLNANHTEVEEEVVPLNVVYRKGKKRASETTQSSRIRSESDVKAYHIVQQVCACRPTCYFAVDHLIRNQAWAEAVHGDTTFIVMQSGNLELIGVRHRATQTLYMAPLRQIHVDKQYTGPSYGKLHTGLYIAALRDAINRALQVVDCQGLFPYIMDIYHSPQVAQPPAMALANPVQVIVDLIATFSSS